MKKSMLCAGLMTVLSTVVCAESNGNALGVDAEQRASMPANIQLAQNSASTGSSIQTPPREQMIAADEVKTPPTQGLQTPTDKGTETPSTTDQLPASGTGSGTPTPAASNSSPVNNAIGGAGTTSTINPATGTNMPATGTSVPSTGINTPATGTAPNMNTATPTNGSTNPATGGTPATTAPTLPSTNSSTQTPGAGTPLPAGTSGATTPAVTPPQPLNCSYRIPAETTHIEQTIVMKWAEKAAEQSFDFDHDTIDNQLVALKSCYTEQGWQGFNDALQKSGNLNAIKSQQLTVSSMVNGESKITEIKDNQWKISIPMQVVYQNDKEKLTQPLTVNLVVGRKISGDLGIMQMIAIPTQTTSTSNSSAPLANPGTTTTSPTTPAQ